MLVEVVIPVVLVGVAVPEVLVGTVVPNTKLVSQWEIYLTY